MCSNKLFFCLIFQLIFVVTKPENPGEVILAIVLYRHGDRTPIDPYPNDPYKNNSLWPVPWGELTDVGKRGQFKLGQWLRNRFNDLLPRNYNRKDIHVQSTDVDRTLMSAYSNLAGLYEPNKNSNWNPDILWTPIPVHTIPENLDKVLAGSAPCPRYKSEEQAILNSPTFRNVDEKNKDLYRYLARMSGSNVRNVKDVARLYDDLLIEELNHFKLPNWTENVYPEPMRELSGLSFSIPCYTKVAARLKIGLFVNEIITNMRNKIEGKINSERKMWMYSAHDTTIANVLQGLGVFQPHCPPYLSLILFELRKKNGEYFVAMHYRNSTGIPPHLMEIPGCEKLCPFEKFQTILSPLVPDNWDEECEERRKFLRGRKFFDPTTTASIGFMTAASLAFLIFLSIAMVLKFYKSQRWHQSDFAYTILKMDATNS